MLNLALGLAVNNIDLNCKLCSTPSKEEQRVHLNLFCTVTKILTTADTLFF